jgi:hypothetical protein
MVPESSSLVMRLLTRDAQPVGQRRPRRARVGAQQRDQLLVQGVHRNKNSINEI